MPDTATPLADARARLWEFAEQCEAQAGPELTVPADGARRLATDLRDLLARATTPGDRDRGREAQVEYLAQQLATMPWERTAEEWREHWRWEARRALDHLRALAAPAETEAGERDRLAAMLAPILRAIREVRVGDHGAYAFDVANSAPSGASGMNVAALAGLLADAVLAATPPAQGPTETEAWNHVRDVASTLSEIALDPAEQGPALNALSLALRRLAATAPEGEAGSVPSREDVAALVANLDDVHAGTEEDDDARTILAAIVALRKLDRARVAATPPAPEGEAGNLPRTTHEADEQVWAVHDELRRLGRMSKSRGPFGVLVGPSVLHGLADQLTSGRWRPVPVDGEGSAAELDTPLVVGQVVRNERELDDLPIGVVLRTNLQRRVAVRESSSALHRLWSVTGLEHGLAAPEDLALLPARILDLPGEQAPISSGGV